jgi:hypothetical protein
MRRILILVALALLAFVPIGTTAPVGGAWSSGERVNVEPSRPWSKVMTFRAGERAAVLALGDHKPVVRLHVSVYDVARNQLVAEEKMDSEKSGDLAGVVWYPPRDGDYRIEVRHDGNSANKLYIAIK